MATVADMIAEINAGLDGIDASTDQERYILIQTAAAMPVPATIPWTDISISQEQIDGARQIVDFVSTHFNNDIEQARAFLNAVEQNADIMAMDSEDFETYLPSAVASFASSGQVTLGSPVVSVEEQMTAIREIFIEGRALTPQENAAIQREIAEYERTSNSGGTSTTVVSNGSSTYEAPDLTQTFTVSSLATQLLSNADIRSARQAGSLLADGRLRDTIEGFRDDESLPENFRDLSRELIDFIDTRFDGQELRALEFLITMRNHTQGEGENTRNIGEMTLAQLISSDSLLDELLVDFNENNPVEGIGEQFEDAWQYVLGQASSRLLEGIDFGSLTERITGAFDGIDINGLVGSIMGIFTWVIDAISGGLDSLGNSNLLARVTGGAPEATNVASAEVDPELTSGSTPAPGSSFT